MRAVGAPLGEIKRRIPYVLELVGLENKTRRLPGERVSGGEQQRVAIARALVNNPETIIADEPTGNLDPERSFEIMSLLERINEMGTTMLVVTHEKDLVNRFSKRVIALEKGRLSATIGALITIRAKGLHYHEKARFSIFFHEGISNMFSHGFMSFATVGITIACLLIMGTFSLVSLNANANLQSLQDQSVILAFVDESYTEAEAKALQPQIERISNVASVDFIGKEEAMETYGRISGRREPGRGYHP